MGMGMGMGGMAANVTVIAIQQGDPDIEPQESTNWSVGGDVLLIENWGPISNVRLNLSFLNVKFENRIDVVFDDDRQPLNANETAACGTSGAGGVITEFWEFPQPGFDDGLGRCYDGNLAALDPGGNFWTSNTDLTAAYSYFSNLLTAEQEALNFGINGSVSSPFAQIGVSLRGTYYLKYRVQPNVQVEPVDAIGITGVLGAANRPVREWAANGGLSFRWFGGNNTFTQGHSTNLTFRYTDEIRNANTGVLSQSSLLTTDLRHSWRFSDSTDISFTARNIFGTQRALPDNVPQRT